MKEEKNRNIATESVGVKIMQNMLPTLSRKRMVSQMLTIIGAFSFFAT